MAILAEVLRQKGADDEAASIAKAIVGLGTMLDRLREVAAVLTANRDALDLVAHLRAATARFACPGGVQLGAAPAQAIQIRGDARRVDELLDSLLACATASLPDGGAIAFDRTEAGVTVRAEGPRIDAPAARMIAHLVPTRPSGGADWFRLCCQVEGLGADLRVEHDTTTLRAELQFPAP
ncbi:MAG: hypothetical protein H6835_04230 [Planctomycetes bacterium]|nr:hypothetical protein [Planctomycetota bacterium]